MASLQILIAELLLELKASRVVLQLIKGDGQSSVRAEAVTNGLRHMRDDAAACSLLDGVSARGDASGEWTIVADTQSHAPSLPVSLTSEWEVRAQIVVPILRDGSYAGTLHVHQAGTSRQWSDGDIHQIRQVLGKISNQLDERAIRPLDFALSDIRDAGIQALLDGIRITLNVQRCTLRQDVTTAYAFPVTFESKGVEVNSLLGDFTIVQTSQPVIQEMIRERHQVVQNDCSTASSDPLFHTMRAHYGALSAQIVTPLFRGGALVGALSIHNLHTTRVWSPNEIAFAKGAVGMIGTLIGATLA